MNPQQIVEQVKIEADARFGETVERLLLILRNRHTHQCWRKECGCEYCQFINGRYIQAKLAYHQLKKRINKVDYWNCSGYEITLTTRLVYDQLKQKARIHELKSHKKELQGNII